jgi:hypothetical protein
MEGRMADDTGGIFDTTHPVLLLHPQLFEAKAFKAKNGKVNGDPKFSANLGFAADHPDLTALKSLAVKVARAKFGDGVDLKTLAFPFQNGDKKADEAKVGGKNRDFQRGLVIVPARSKFRPGLSAIVNREIVEYDDESAVIQAKPKFFFGAEVLVKLNLVAYDAVGSNKPGVNAYLNAVCATGKGKRIASSTGVSESFRSYAGQMSAVDPTSASDDDADSIPF